MSILGRWAEPWRGADERHGPLPLLLLGLTIVTGLVDAVSYLGLGHVFVANMTGNIVFLGFAVGGAKEFSGASSLVAIAAFLAGALGGGRIAAGFGRHRGRLLAVAVTVKIAMVAAALALALSGPGLAGGEVKRYGLILLLSLSMGLQNATARRLAVPDLTTTVLTLTVTGLAADSALVGGNNPDPGRRLVATGAMFIGAAAGTLLLFGFGAAAVLAVVLVLLAFTGAGAYRHWSSTGAWTEGR